EMILGDFRFMVEAKLSPDTAASGIYFRAEPTPQRTVRGYHLEMGSGRWGRLTTPGAEEPADNSPRSLTVHSGDWNRWEIVAVGSRIRVALNGKLVFDMDDPAGARQGILAFELSGRSAEVRFRDLLLQLNPTSELTTVKGQ